MVNSVVHSLHILQFLARSGEAHGVTAIARFTGISPSSAFNICKTLTAEKFLHFDPLKKSYSVGAAAIELAGAASDGERAFARARDFLESSVDQFGVTSAFWRVTNDERLVLEGLVESRTMMRIQMTVGQRIPALSGAMGRCYAATSGLDEGQLFQKFDTVRWQNRPDFQTYKAEVEVTRIQGWAADRAQFIRGILTVAAPIMDLSGRLRFLIANSSFYGQIPDEQIQSLGKETKLTADNVQRVLFG
ncbi:MAG: helix-turn-helix domain-containing protein [Mesorhizobium sp.]|nr:helix-turn-helix domain-containing protein [Mesorhizobium sp.]